jgi:hypothetical protein
MILIEKNRERRKSEKIKKVMPYIIDENWAWKPGYTTANRQDVTARVFISGQVCLISK